MRHPFSVVILASLLLPSAVFADTRLPGHRAVYELGIARAGQQPQAITGAAGRYVFELEDICDGYTLNERLVVRLETGGDAVLTDYRLSAYESNSGDLYRFSTETDFNGKTGQEAEGTLTADGDSFTLDYKSADDVSFDSEVLSPLAHLRAVLDAAQAGENRHAATVFDGDVDKPVFFAVTRIAEAEGKAPEIEGAEALNGLGNWRLDSVYFPPGDSGTTAEELPEFSFSGTIYENGVVDDLVLDYVTFALSATLIELEVIDGGC